MEPFCFLFGHADAPESVSQHIVDAVEACYRERGIRSFLVGQYGNFDSLARRAVCRLKVHHPDMRLLLLMPYAPTMRRDDIPDGIDEVIAPPVETVPPRARIVAANRYAVSKASCIICYVCRIGNSRELLDIAAARHISVINCC